MATQAVPSTLFVSRLPYSATNTDLTTLFSSLGPIKKCFIVTDPITKKSKGVGYVQFAVKEDAQRAMDQLDGEQAQDQVRQANVTSSVLGSKGNRIRVEWAKKERDSLKQRNEKRKRGVEEKLGHGTELAEKDNDQQQQPHRADRSVKRSKSTKIHTEAEAIPGSSSAGGETTRDVNASRTLVLTGLSKCDPIQKDNKALYKRVRKVGDVESVIYPLTDTDPTSVGEMAHVVFRTPNHATLAISKLDQHVWKGAPLRAVLKRQWDGMARLESGITNAGTKARREETIAQIEACSRLPIAEVRKRAGVREWKGKNATDVRALMMGQKGKEETNATTAASNVGLHGVDGRWALTRAGGGAVATGKIGKQSRLIVRNLPFDVTEEDLRAIFVPFGPLYQVDVPQTDAPGKRARARKAKEAKAEAEASEEEDEDGEPEEEPDQAMEEDDVEEVHADSDVDVDDEEAKDAEEDSASPEPAANSVAVDKIADSSTPTRGRGFAFVWFVAMVDAERAMVEINGTEIGHGEAEKLTYKSATQSRDRRKLKELLDEVRKRANRPRKVAVDWAVSKDEWEKRKEEEGPEEKDVREEDEEAGDEETSDTDPIDADVLQEAQLPIQQGDRPPQPEEGTTLFVRNLPFMATEEEFRSLFRAFGSMRYARITMDKATNKPKGTGFVCYWDKADADQVLETARAIESESGATGANAIRVNQPGAVAKVGSGSANPFSMSGNKAESQDTSHQHFTSILTADVAAPLTSKLTLHGRLLAVTPAIKREDAQAMESSAAAARQKGDKRNTWLLREGVPFPGSRVAKILAEAEANRRLDSFSIRKKQLESNPSLFVSKTRLSVRNLPLYVTDKTLKKLALHAVREFGRESKNGQRLDALSKEEEADETQSPSLANASDKKRMKFKERPTAVIQSKVVRATDRLDPILASSGVGRSRGYGFLEMRSYKEALMVLRFANANREVAKWFNEWHQTEMEDLAKRLRKELLADSEGRETLEAEKKQDKETLLKRIEKRIEEVKAQQKQNSKKSTEVEMTAGSKAERGGLILIEFSIENVTITRKREERGIAAARDSNDAYQKGGDSSKAGGSERRDARGGGRFDRDRDEMGESRPRDGRGKAMAHRSQKKADLKIRAEKKERFAKGTNSTAESSVARIISRKRKEKKGGS